MSGITDNVVAEMNDAGDRLDEIGRDLSRLASIVREHERYFTDVANAIAACGEAHELAGRVRSMAGHLSAHRLLENDEGDPT